MTRAPSISFVFFHRLGFADASVAGLRTRFFLSILLVNVLQNHRDHWRGRAAAVGFAAHVAFPYGRECVPRLFRRDEPGEPRRGSLLVLWSPLGGPGFAGYGDAFQTRLMRRATRSIDDIDHRPPQLRHRVGGR